MAFWKWSHWLPYDIQNVDIDFFPTIFYSGQNLQRLLYMSITLPYGLIWNIVVMSGLVLVAATWNCYISYKGKYVGQLVLHLLPSWTLGSSSKCGQLGFFCIGITLVDVHQNKLNLFHSFVGGLLVILIDRMIFLLLFFDVTRMSMRTVFFLSANRILCL